MPTTTIIFFRDEDGSAPFLDWFGRLPEKAKVQCRARLGLLADQGHQLRRPAADYLRDGIYELRAKAGRIQYRMLYFKDRSTRLRSRFVVSVSVVNMNALRRRPPLPWAAAACRTRPAT